MSSDDNPVIFGSIRRRVVKSRIRELAGQLSRQVARGRTFSCLIAPDSELRRLNRKFRGKDYPTDVLSFPCEQRRAILGDVAISVDRAAQQAKSLGHSIEDEIGVLMLHGVLHLMGMDHEVDRGRMSRAEGRWRKKLGLPDGLIERARS